MSREIKFRVFFPKGRYAWVIKDGEKDRLAYTGVPIMQNVDLCEQHTDTTEYYICSRDGIIMQYIGLNDKNGVEIYEGDILSIMKDDISFLATPCYSLAYMGYALCSPKNTMSVPYDKNGNAIENVSLSDYVEIFEHNSPNLEVVGNVYQNSELIK